MKNEDLTYDQQIFVLSSLNKDFIDDVAKIRKKWGIPVGGFKNGEKHKIWFDKMHKESLRLLDKGKYQTSPEALFLKDIRPISTQWDRKYGSVVHDHIIGAHIFIYPHLGGTGPILNQGLYSFSGNQKIEFKLKKEETVYLFVFNEDTRKEDVVSAFNMYKDSIKKREKRKRTLLNFKIYKKILELDLEGRSSDEIINSIRLDLKRKSYTKDQLYRDRDNLREYQLPYKRRL